MNTTPDQMTNEQLAKALGEVYRAYQDEYPDDEQQEQMIWLENEACDRISIPLDETEQGLSERAYGMIRDFIASNGVTV